MELEAKVRYHPKGGPPDWIVECPTLDIITQGKTRADALKMLRSAIEELLEWYFPKEAPDSLEVSIRDTGKSRIGVSCSDVAVLMSFVLIRQREQSGLNVRQAAERLGSLSPNAYKRYECGDVRISVEKFDQLVSAVNPVRQVRLRIV